MYILDHLLFLSMIHSFLCLNEALCTIILGLLAYTYYLLQKAQRELQVQVTESQRYQTTLQETEERLRLVIQNMPVMINAFDSDRNILVWNQECERVTGYTSAEIVNNPQCREMLYPDADYRQKMMTDWVIGGNNYRDWEWETTCKNGSIKTLAWSNISDRFPIPGWVSWGIGIDITELKQEQALLSTQNHILELIATGAELPQILAAVTTLIDKHSDQNQAKCAVLLMDEDDQTKLQAVAGTSIPDSQSVSICPCVSSCGTTTYVSKPVVVSDIAEKLPDSDFGSCWSVPIINGNGDDLGTLAMYYPTARQPSSYDQRLIDLCVYLAGIAIERQRSQKALQDSYSILEQRVLERTTQLAVANKELEAFSYSVSHDLRAPLRSVDGFSLTLLERYESLFDEKGKHYLHRIRAASQRMGQLIDDLLNLSRVTRSEMQRQTVDLSAIVTEIITDLQQGEKERKVEFDILPQVIIQGDGRLLRVVLENLLNNAWKFTSKSQHPRIEFGISPPLTLSPSPVYFVRDNGAGFEMSYAHKLFGAFQRLHTTEEFPGTGIGLATSQRIIHRHGGEIWAEAELDRGATFYFTLPK